MRPETVGPKLTLAGIFIIFVLPMAIFGPYDQEEWGLGVWSTLKYAEGLWNWNIPTWTDMIGLGTPLPIGHRLELTLPFLFYPYLPIRWVIFTYYTFYLGFALIYVWRLAGDYAIRGSVRVVVVMTFMLSAPTIQYMYADDWLSIFHNWSLFPAILFYVRRLLLRNNSSDIARQTIILGLLGGVWALNGHSGHMAVLASILMVYVAVIVWPQPRLIMPLFFAGLIALLIGSEHLYYLVSETVHFPKDFARTHVQGGITLSQLVQTLLRPIDIIGKGYVSGFFSENSLWSNLEKLWSLYLQKYLLRVPFVGSIFFIAIVTWVTTTFNWRNRVQEGAADSHAVAAAIIFSFFLVFMQPAWLMNIPSATWMYRDGLVMFGIFAAGRWFMKWQRYNHGKFQHWVILALVLQVVQLVAVAFPAIHRVANGNGMNYYKNLGREEMLPGWVKSYASEDGARVLTSSAFMRKEFSNDGLYGITDLTFLKLAPLNGWFKSVSMDSLYPSRTLSHGYIAGDLELLNNKPMLDVLGVELVLALDSEHVEHLALISTRNSNYKGKKQQINLYKNSNVWPKAFVMDKDILKAPDIRACQSDGLLCRDFSVWKQYRSDAPIRLSGNNGKYSLNTPASSKSQLVVTTMLYRPEWVATSAGVPLKIVPVWNALIGINLPPGAETVALEFRPILRNTLWFISTASLMITIGLLLIFTYLNLHVRRSTDIII